MTTKLEMISPKSAETIQKAKAPQPKSMPKGLQPLKAPEAAEPLAAVLQRAWLAPETTTPSETNRLQHTLGNRAIGRMASVNGRSFISPESGAADGKVAQTSWQAILNRIDTNQTAYHHNLNNKTQAVQRVGVHNTVLQRDGNPPTMAPGPAHTRELLHAFSYQPASSIAEYVALTRSLEREYSGLNPRQILAMLRQVYYGRPWSVRPTTQWQDVLPQSPAMPDPRNQIRSGPGSLFHALQESQEVGGTDVGHVLTGLEAMLNPTAQVEIEVLGPNPVVAMPNTEFATWGGDLGSAAGQAVVDRYLSRRVKSDQEYFDEFASPADLEGDIDAFAIQHGAAQSGGLAALLGVSGRPGSGTRISQILQQYYLNAGSAMGTARTNRYRDFISHIGGQINGNSIANRAALLWPIAMRVSSFAFVWYMKEYKNERNVFSALATTGPGLNTHLRIKSLTMTNLFFNWLEAGLRRS